MPGTAPWRIIIIEDVDRMMERTTNVLLKEIEEPSPHDLAACAPSAQDVLPTIRSRTPHRQLGRTVQPGGGEILESQGLSRKSRRAARLSEGISASRACMPRTNASRRTATRLIVGVLACIARRMPCAGNPSTTRRRRPKREVNVKASEAEADFRRINGLGPKDRIPRNCVAHTMRSPKKTSSNDAPPDSRVTCSTVRSIRSPVSTVTWRCCRTTPRTRWGSSTWKPFRHHGIVGTARPPAGPCAGWRTSHRAPQAQWQRSNLVLVFEALFCALIP